MMERIENSKEFTAEQVSEIVSIVKAAITEPCEFTQLNGCGRVYMHIGYSKMLKSYKVVKALDGLGPIKAFRRPGESGVHFYMGYDNAHGGIYSRAEHIAKRLKEHGVIAFIDCDGD